MKTPEQWLKEFDFMGGEYDIPERFIPIIKKIQEDTTVSLLGEISLLISQLLEKKHD
jgi:hypothetical protein